MTTDEKKKSQNLRKKKERDKKKAMGVKKVEVTLSQSDRDKLTELCQVRGGVRGPYDADEFIATLIRRNHENLQAQLKALGKCPSCKLELPGGCNGSFKGQSDCWHTLEYRQLYL